MSSAVKGGGSKGGGRKGGGWTLAGTGKGGGKTGGVGKGGGGNGGGGKGGGGKGKGKSGPCPSGQITICLDQPTYKKLTDAFNNAVPSTSLTDGCLPGFLRVCLDSDAAQVLFSSFIVGLQGAGGKKKKKKGKMKKSA